VKASVCPSTNQPFPELPTSHLCRPKELPSPVVDLPLPRPPHRSFPDRHLRTQKVDLAPGMHPDAMRQSDVEVEVAVAVVVVKQIQRAVPVEVAAKDSPLDAGAPKGAPKGASQVQRVLQSSGGYS